MSIKILDWDKDTQTEAAVEITTTPAPIVEKKTFSQIGAEIQEKDNIITLYTRKVELANEEIARLQANIDECVAEKAELEALIAQLPAKPKDFEPVAEPVEEIIP